MSNLFVHVTSDDWEGLYQNGLLQMEGHQLPPMHVTAILKDGYDEYRYYEIIGTWLQEEGNLPQTLDELYEKENK